MIATLMLLVAPPLVPVQGPFSEGPALGFDRVTQTDIVGGGMTLDEISQILLEKTLRSCEGNKTAAAEKMGVSLRWVHYKTKEWNIS